MGFLHRIVASRSGHKRPARHPGNRSPFGKPGHPPRRRRPCLVRPLAPLGGSPTQGHHVLPCPRFSRRGQAATPYRNDPFAAQAICLAVRASAEVPGRQAPSDSPNPARLFINSPRQPLAQTPRPYIGPVLFDVVQTRSAVRFAVNHPPTGWNIGEGRPQAVLLLVVDQDKKAAIFVVERIDAQRFSRHLVDMSGNVPNPTGGQQGRSGVSATCLM